MRTASIIIPTFNRAHLVRRAIESAIHQTYPCEVILCDHGSSDNTMEVAAGYKGKIHYVRREEDMGPIVCWRDGIEHATSEICHINYDDDWLQPMFMEKTIALLNDDVGFVYSNVNMHRLDGTLPTIGIYKHPQGIQPMKDFVNFLLRFSLTISPGCSIFRRKDILKNLLLEIPNASGLYGKNSGVGEDLLLFLLTSLDYPKYAHIGEPLANFLHHPDSITVDSYLSEKEKDLIEAYRNAKNYYYSLPESFSPPFRLQHLIFKIKWNYKAGTLIEKAVNRTKRYRQVAFNFARKLLFGSKIQ